MCGSPPLHLQHTTAGQKKKFFVAGHVVPFSVPLDIVIAQRAAGSLLTLRPHTQAYLPSVRGCAAALDIIIV